MVLKNKTESVQKVKKGKKSESPESRRRLNFKEREGKVVQFFWKSKDICLIKIVSRQPFKVFSVPLFLSSNVPTLYNSVRL